MGLALRPTGLGLPADKDRSDYTLFSGEFAVGRIYEERGAPADVQWFWAITGGLFAGVVATTYVVTRPPPTPYYGNTTFGVIVFP